MFREWCSRVVFGLVGCLSCLTFAQIVHHIAEVSQPVVDRSSSVLQKALPSALSQVLIRISGNTSVTTLPSIQTALVSPKNYVISYRYTKNQVTNADQPWVLHVRFDQQAVDQLLEQNGQAVWSANRPRTLLWLSVPQADQVGVLAAGDDSPLLRAIQHTTQLRGLLVLFPTMDLQDQAHAPQDISTLPTNEALQAEASRYGVESILAVAITSDDDSNTLTAQWRLLLDGTPYTWQKSGDDVGALLQAGLNNAADMMANQFATLNSSGLRSDVMLGVSGVTSLTQYSHVLSLIKKLSPVASVKVVDMDQNNLLLNVSVAGGSEALANALKMVMLLKPQTPAITPWQPADLYYQLESHHDSTAHA